MDRALEHCLKPFAVDLPRDGYHGLELFFGLSGSIGFAAGML